VADSERASIVWRKSMASGSNGDCVEVACTTEAVLVRNSQDPSGPQLSFSYSEWAAFLIGARLGEFDAAGANLRQWNIACRARGRVVPARSG
jgi:hypothetical protein